MPLAKSGGYRTGVKAIRVAERQQQALELRKAGKTLAQIAQHLGYKGQTGAAKAVETALARSIQPAAESVRQLEIERLDALMDALWPAALRGQWLAVDRVLAVMDRRAKLLGLDAPTKIDVEMQIRQDAEAEGMDPEAAVAEARRIWRERQRA